jgi:hypothetical protein
MREECSTPVIFQQRVCNWMWIGGMFNQEKYFCYSCFIFSMFVKNVELELFKQCNEALEEFMNIATRIVSDESIMPMLSDLLSPPFKTIAFSFMVRFYYLFDSIFF